MDVWQLALFGAAAVLAMRCLAGLMTGHRMALRATLLAEEEARRRAEKAKAKKQNEIAQKEQAAKPRTGAA